MNKLILAAVFVFTFFLGGTGYAEQENWLDDANKQLAGWQKELIKWRKQPPDMDALLARQNAVAELRLQATDCIETAGEQLDELTKKISALGDQQTDEADKVKKFRLELTRDKKAIEDRSALCRVINLAARESIDGLKTLRAELVSRSLTHRGPDIWQKTQELFEANAWLKISFTHFQPWPAWLIGLISLTILFPLARFISRLLLKPDSDETLTPGKRLLTLLAQRLTWIAALFSLMLFTYFGGNNLLSALLLALLFSLLLAPLLKTLLCHKVESCLGGLPARILLDLLLIGLSLHLTGIDSILQPNALDVLYGLYLLALMLTAIWLVLAKLGRHASPLMGALRLLLMVALIAGPAAFWLGYRALSDILVIGVYGSLIALVIAVLTYHLLNSLIGYLEDSGNPLSARLHTWLGYQNAERISEFRIIRILLIAGLFGLFLYSLLHIWNIPTTDISALLVYFNEGFEIGSTTIVPGKIISAIVAFLCLLIFARWLKKQLGEHWLTKTSLDSGAQQSIVSLTTYTIVGLGILFALNTAGVELQNLAIVAGALSVGIGFGLQNIVNNFVSGLILLFERPVQPGDWIVVGNTEGYVKKISIRYTQIQTFDRSDVLVPNSELISSPVTNWMLRDHIGRVIVKVGVAYGTDPQRVSEILNRVARAHPFVLVKNPRAPAPQVLFMAFGDSSLDFELRCYLKDVNYRLSVHSDLMFAIEAALREEGIEIPFPQQVVHFADAVRIAGKNASD